MRRTRLIRMSSVAKWLCLAVIVLCAGSALAQTQPGLLQEWVRAANPGNRDGVLDLIDTGGLLVSPFHANAGTSWWTGSQNPGWDVPQYPAEVIDALDNPGDNGNYVVRGTGEIFIPESGTYRFADGNDDYTYWAVDVDRSGVAGDDPDEVLIDDNEWTNLQRTENFGGGGLGEIEVDVPAGGEWLAVEFLMGEAVGTDAGVIYWDYGVDGGGLNSAAGFPEFPEDPVGLTEAEKYLIPDSHLRAPAGPMPGGPGHYVAGLGRIGRSSLQGGITNEVVAGGGKPQAGLLQEWVRQTNPGSRNALVDLIENEELIVPAFHSSDGTSWWTGSQSPGWLVPKYPSEVIDQLDNPNDNDGYVVRLTGELFIPESGTYVFADGNDDYTYWAVDADRSGVAGDDRTEVLINDNAWTNLERSANNGGSGYGEIAIDVSPGGEWIAVEFLLGESVGTDAGVIYWDYAVNGGGLNAAEGFPQARDEAADLFEAETWLIPDTHLRARTEGEVVKADLVSRLDRNTPYEFDVDVGSQENDQLVLGNRDPTIFTTIADVDGVTLRINPVGALRAGDSFDILDADQIQGTPRVTSLDPTQLWSFDPRTGRVIFVGAGVPGLQPGDADQDLDFDQLDLVRVLVASKYLTAGPATWGEGDWNGAPGGAQGSPPAGDGRFNQLDIIAALAAGKYMSGPYAAIDASGQAGDAQTSIGYDANTGEVWEDVVAGDLNVVGSLAGGGDLGDVVLVYVPEPSTLALLVLSFVGLVWWRSHRR